MIGFNLDSVMDFLKKKTKNFFLKKMYVQLIDVALCSGVALS